VSLLERLEQPTFSIDEWSGEDASKPRGFALTTKADPSTRAEAAVRVTTSFRIIFLLPLKTSL
jgi:hypothetical protein